MNIRKTTWTIAVAAACTLGWSVQYRYADSVDGSHLAATFRGHAGGATQGASAADSPSSALTLERQCVERSERLQRQLGAEVAVSVHSPFVLAGTAEVDLEDQYASVIEPACEILNRRFFDCPPDQSLGIVLFSDEVVYRASAERLFFDREVSRFGYFKPGRRIVLANLAQGQAALRHELVHALMHFDFPDAPPWLQEGLATMYEAVTCSVNSTGTCWQPAVNWRLTVLQRELRRGAALDLRRLLRASDLSGMGEAVAYAQACYLCMYLDRQGRLESIYRSMRGNVREDPYGEHALKVAFPYTERADLERQFHDWALSLKR